MLISLGGYMERRFDCCILSIRCNYAICSPMNAACVMNINELHRFLPMAESWLMNINKQALAAVGFVNSRFTGGESWERERRSVGGLRNCEREEKSHRLFFSRHPPKTGALVSSYLIFKFQFGSFPQFESFREALQAPALQPLRSVCRRALGCHRCECVTDA